MNLADLPDDSDNCWHCGAELPLDWKWGIRKFCSRRCANKYHWVQLRAERDARLAGRTCINCGGAVPLERKGDALTCSEKCMRRIITCRQKPRLKERRRQARQGRTCEICSGPIDDAKPAGTKRCSRACTNEYWRQETARRRARARKQSAT